MPKKTGGPAFPFTPHPQQQLPDGRWDQGYDPGEEGMSLRDWFAGMALGHIPALLAANDKNKSVEQIAKWAYEVADAMLAEREKGDA